MRERRQKESPRKANALQVGTGLRQLQWQALQCGGERPPDADSGTSGISGAEVSWHRSLDDVPTGGPAIYIAHEFLDALPVHQFQRMDRGW